MFLGKQINNELSAYARVFPQIAMMAEDFLLESGLLLERVYAGSIKNFIYEYLGIDTIIGRHQKTIISQTDYIIVYEIEGIKKTKVFMFELSEYSFEVYQRVLVSLKSMAKCNVICCFLDENRNRYSLCGRLYSMKNETMNLIISDWLVGYGISSITGERFRIDVADCGYDDKEFYINFLYLIARPYVRYPESKMFVSRGYNNYWNYIDEDIFGKENWDREELFEENNSYYKNLYQEDFYDDFSENCQQDEDFEDIEYDEEESDFEWTLLEMQLQEEYEDDIEQEYENIEDSLTGEFEMPKDLSPVQMLEYIKSQKG